MAMVRSPSLDASSGPVTGSPSVKLLGFWSSIATATLATAWFGLFVFQLLALPQGWFGIEEYADRFTRLELANLWPSLFLGWTYLLMLAALHYLVAEENRAWTLAALSLGIVYAAMETINYTIQIVAVAPNLEADNSKGFTYGRAPTSIRSSGRSPCATGSWPSPCLLPPRLCREVARIVGCAASLSSRASAHPFSSGSACWDGPNGSAFQARCYG